MKELPKRQITIKYWLSLLWSHQPTPSIKNHSSRKIRVSRQKAEVLVIGGKAYFYGVLFLFMLLSFKYKFHGDLLKTKIVLCPLFCLSSFFFCQTFMFCCFWTSFESQKKSPGTIAYSTGHWRSLKQLYGMGRFPKGCERGQC